MIFRQKCQNDDVTALWGVWSKIFSSQNNPGEYLGKVRKFQHKRARRFRDNKHTNSRGPIRPPPVWVGLRYSYHMLPVLEEKNA